MTGSRPRPRSTTRWRTPLAILLFVLIGTATQAWSDTLERIRSQGKIRLGYRPDAQPFSYRDEKGAAAGYSVLLCQKIADEVKTELGLERLEVEFIPLQTDGRFGEQDADRLDLFCGATVTLARRQEHSFSIPIFPSGVGALLRSDSPERLRAILEGREPPPRPQWRASLGQVLEKRVLSAQADTPAESWLVRRRDQLKLDTEIVPVKSYQEGVERVLNGSSDVMFGDRALLLQTAARSSGSDELVVLDRMYTQQSVALALARGDDDFRLFVDRTLSRIYRSGEIEAIYARFFGKPNEITLAFFRFVALSE
jgi:ABC-type amino acid transport substrate-binding protein